MFLKQWLIKTADMLSKQQYTVYYGLDRLSRAVFNALYTLSIVGEIRWIKNKKVITMVHRLTKQVAKYCFKLHNPFLIGELLTCFLSILDYMKMFPPNNILHYAVQAVFSNNIDDCSFFALAAPLISWYRRYPQFFMDIWREFAGRIRQERDFLKALAKRVMIRIDNILAKDEIDLRLLAYALSFVACVGDLMESRSLIKLVQYLIADLQKRYLALKERALPIFYLSLIEESLLRAGLHTWWVVPGRYVNIIKAALRRYTEIRKLALYGLMLDATAIALALLAISLCLSLAPSSIIPTVLSIIGFLISIIGWFHRKLSKTLKSVDERHCG